MPVWWHIYYDRGEFSSEDGDPWAAPRTGVVVIARADPMVGYRLIHSGDYYYYEADRDGWQASDLIGMADHLMRAPRPLVLFGRTIDSGQYREVLHSLRERYGPKQGYLEDEPRRHV